MVDVTENPTAGFDEAILRWRLLQLGRTAIEHPGITRSGPGRVPFCDDSVNLRAERIVRLKGGEKEVGFVLPELVQRRYDPFLEAVVGVRGTIGKTREILGLAD